jgi:2-keto-4-pentenoate hydratase/2-oxohepta-3-ene-1,7-dioic acid hydratase in catechol pathway
MSLPAAPILFTKPRSAIASPYPSPISIPLVAQDGTSDYEAELCVVIGKTGRNIPEDRALEYVLGYTCANDVSARTAQMATSQWCFSKGLDGSCPLGPVLVMRDAVGEPNAEGWGIKTVLEGRVVQDASTRLVLRCLSWMAFHGKGMPLT